jgi:hypothetical protein
VYDDGKAMLQLAIEEYDQAVMDLTMSIVGSKHASELPVNERSSFQGNHGSE